MRLYADDYYDAGGAKSARSIATILKSLRLSGTFGSVLDIGCARGTLLEAVSPYATALTGVDVSAVAIDAAQKRLPDAVFTAADVQAALPFTDGLFNTVFMLDVLEHLERPVAAVKEISRVLSPGGRLVFSTPNANSPITLLKGERWFGGR